MKCDLCGLSADELPHPSPDGKPMLVTGRAIEEPVIRHEIACWICYEFIDL